MISGIGVDICSVDRIAELIERRPKVVQKLFTEAEAERPVASLAARFAAKEALVKALGSSYGLAWLEIEVVNDEAGKPCFVFFGTTARTIGERRVHLSLSHDAGMAIAMVVVEC